VIGKYVDNVAFTASIVPPSINPCRLQDPTCLHPLQGRQQRWIVRSCLGGLEDEEDRHAAILAARSNQHLTIPVYRYYDFRMGIEFMSHAEMTAHVERMHAERYPTGCRPEPDWCEECAKRLTGAINLNQVRVLGLAFDRGLRGDTFATMDELKTPGYDAAYLRGRVTHIRRNRRQPMNGEGDGDV
jgi:hypothetical protein